MRSLLFERRRSVAMIFAIALVAIVLAVGLTIDFTTLTRSRHAIQEAADQSALAYAKTYMATGGKEGPAKADAEAIFAANITANGLGTVKLTAVRLVKDAKGTATAVEIDFTSELPMRFGALVGTATRTVGGTATVGIGSVGGSIAIVVDTSDSMGLAATDSDRDKMRAAYYGCEFACHMVEPSIGPENPLTVAREYGVKLRLDVAVDAVNTMASGLSEQSGGDKIKLGLYAFHRELVKLQPVSSGTPALVMKASKKLTLGYGLNATDETRTDFDVLFPALADELAKDTGATILLITDGVHSRMFGKPWTDVKPVDPGLCKPLKDRGHIIAVVYTRYLEAIDSDPFIEQVEPFYDDIEPKLKACASPGYFAHGDTPEEIEAAFSQITGKLASIYLAK